MRDTIESSLLSSLLPLGFAAADAAEVTGVGSISSALGLLLDLDFALALGSTGITSSSSSLMLLFKRFILRGKKCVFGQHPTIERYMLTS